MSKNTSFRSLLLVALLLAPLSIARAAKGDFDEAPVPVKSVAPDYPSQMKQQGVTGIVTLTVAIDENGDVAECTVAKSTRPEFEQAAVNAVGKWKFRPARKAGENVKAKVNIPIKFSSETA